MFSKYFVFKAEMKLCTLEGIPGCGKSTVLQLLEQFDDVLTVKEPLEHWTNFQGRNMLKLVYDDMKAHAFQFQIHVQNTMYMRLKKLLDSSKKPPIVVMERSVHSANVFAQNCLFSGQLTQLEYDLLKETFATLETLCPVRMDVAVYLKVDPKVALERVISRGRMEEQVENVTESYLTKLQEQHDAWLNGSTCPNGIRQVVVYDTNRPISSMESIANHIHDILTYTS
jgi:deoxyadenosine/deoxycytidine kinase